MPGHHDDAAGDDAGTTFRHALLRRPGRSLVDGLTTADLGAPVVAEALRQHAAYAATLEDLGVAVTVLPPDEAHPDSVFIEDAALLAGDLAVLTRPGAPTRRGEPATLEAPLRDRFGELRRIEAPGTLDAGDVLRIGARFLVGLSTRTNAEGARQLAAHLARHGMRCDAMEVPAGLHLKSGLAHLGGRALLATPAMRSALARAAAARVLPRGLEAVCTAPGEARAANALRVNGVVLLPGGCPGTRSVVEALGHAVRTVDVGEFEKLDGGLSCLSLRW